MARKSTTTRTSFYRHFNKHLQDHVSCPKCREGMTIDQFYHHHASENHGLDFRKQCVFCFGRRHWAYGQKNHPDHIHHVVSCLERFAKEAKDVWVFSDDEEETEEEERVPEVCGCRYFQPIPREMYGRPRLRDNFYDSIFEKPDLWEEGIKFDNGLGKDVWGIIQRYLKGDWVWFHIMVKHNIFDTFCKEMEMIRNQFVILPFWCLCDGLETERGKIQHRHMILACEQESAFEEIWKGKVRYEFPSAGRAKKCVKIQSAFHLVRTIVYVSQPKSSCDGGKIPEKLMNPEQWSHFHMNRPLHAHSIAFLCTLFPGGMERLLLEQLGNKNVASWDKVIKCLPDAWGHLKWNVPIHVTGFKFLNCVFPFQYQVTGEETPLYVTLYGNTKLYLKEGNQGGECLFQRIRDEMYVLSRKQQNMMNEIKKIKQEWAMDQKVLLRSKLSEMNAKCDLIQRERDILKEERDILKEERDILKEERDILKEERDLLKEEKDVLKTKENELNAEIMILKFKLENTLVENKIWETKENEWKAKEHELNTEMNTLKNKLQSTLVVDKILKRMIQSQRKLKMINPWRWKRVPRLPRPANVLS